MAVAPSFQKYPTVGEPFEENGREYILIQYPDGHTRKVRWYEDPIKKIRPTKDVLGFSLGYITIFKGDTYPLLDWFRESTARNNRIWGWYFISDEPLPEQIPEGVTPVRLYWKDIANEELDELLPEQQVRAVVESLLYDPGTSEWQGEVGERIDRTLTVTKAIELPDGYYGPSNFYLFSDEAGNEYCWTTAAKKLESGRTYQVRGTIKALQTYKGKKQTVLTRCKVEE